MRQKMTEFEAECKAKIEYERQRLTKIVTDLISKA
jgi:hypothetical protein